MAKSWQNYDTISFQRNSFVTAGRNGMQLVWYAKVDFEDTISQRRTATSTLQWAQSHYRPDYRLLTNLYSDNSLVSISAGKHLCDSTKRPISPCSGRQQGRHLPTCRPISTSFHLWRCCSRGSHYFIQRAQTCFISSCSLLQHFLGLKSVLSIASGANCPPHCPCRKWLGVMGGSSLGSADW
jgi:hypothetical protein